MSKGSDLSNEKGSQNSSNLLLSSRRQSNNQPTAPHINPLLPLSSHYALLNQTLLPAFAKSLARQSYSIAYAAGVQFVEMALVGIPSHAYFDAETSAAVNPKKNSEEVDSTTSKNYADSTGQCEQERQQSIQDAVRVATLLDEMVRTEKVGADAEETQRLRQMADEAASRDDINICGIETSCADWTSVVGDFGLDGSDGREDSSASPTPDQSIWDWVAVHADNACGKLVDEICSGSGQAPASSATSEPENSAREASPRDENDEQFQADMERALYLSGLDAAKVGSLRDADDEACRRRKRHRRLKVSERPKPEHVATKKRHYNREEEYSPPNHRSHSAFDEGNSAVRSDTGGRDGPEVELPSTASVPEQIRSQRARKLDALNALAANCRDDFHALRTTNRIRVYPLNTYQGRVSGSINGCTVIAPLIAIAHLRGEGDTKNVGSKEDENESDANILGDMDWERTSATSSSDFLVDDDMIGVSDKMIEEIIDEGAPSILPCIRAKLNLNGSAFIIPSDVHDFLIDSALLTQDQFVGVSGGNIFDQNHLNFFISALSAEDDSKQRRIAATLFFHEHVVCLHRLVVKKETDDSNEIWFDFIDSLPAKKMLSRDQEESDDNSLSENEMALGESRDALEGLEVSNGSNENGVRLRCSDAESLFAMIRWYAHSKLTDNDRSYISRCAWNDCNTDFDPRVFQAFIWRGL